MKPTIALFTGDPAGIGPEIVAKVLADQEVLQAANLLIIGSRPVLEKGMQAAGVATELPLAPSTLPDRSDEHTSELQSLMRISYAVLCLKNKQKHQTPP